MFVDQVGLESEGDTECMIPFAEPGSGSYHEIYWYKGNRDHIIVRFIENSFLKYYNEFCDGSSPCDTSTKGSLDISTGTLTIVQTEPSDEGVYYYNFYIDNNHPDTGHNYQLQLDIFGEANQQMYTTTLRITFKQCKKKIARNFASGLVLWWDRKPSAMHQS